MTNRIARMLAPALCGVIALTGNAHAQQPVAADDRSGRGLFAS
jgi:hypothetical protein